MAGGGGIIGNGDDPVGTDSARHGSATIMGSPQRTRSSHFNLEMAASHTKSNKQTDSACPNVQIFSPFCVNLCTIVVSFIDWMTVRNVGTISSGCST